MQRKQLFWSIFLGMFLTPVIWAQAPDLMPIDEIRPGMKGVGKTVFSGTTIEEFDVEILAILKNDGQHGDAIMAKVSGGPLPLEEVGVIAGMSGSPIYIDGKLIGALAFGQAFEKEPMIAGITPIHEMLADASRPKSRPGVITSWSEKPSANAWWQPVPIQTPLVLSGGDSRLLAFLQQELAPYAMLPVQGGSSTAAMLQEFSPELEPGASVGVPLMRGDMNITAVGTVTYRDADRILAFGHPMIWGGDVNFPMLSAYVHFVWPNQVVPFKVASPLHEVGAITQDRGTGISGKIGMTPEMIPLEVSVAYTDEALPEKQYAFEVVDVPSWTPMLLGTAGVNAMLDAEGPVGAATVQTRTTIELRDYPAVVLEHVATGDQELLMAVLQAFSPLNTLLSNPFAPVEIERMSLEMTVTHKIQAAKVVGMRIEDHVVRAGDVIDVMLDLRTYGSQDTTTIVDQIMIPEKLQNEFVQLILCDANATMMLEAGRAAGTFQPQNLEQLITLLNERISPHNVVLSLIQLKPGLVVAGRELPSPPLSMLTLLGTPKRSAGEISIAQGRMLVQKRLPTPYVVSGCAGLSLRVDHSGGGLNETVNPIQGDEVP